MYAGQVVQASDIDPDTRIATYPQYTGDLQDIVQLDDKDKVKIVLSTLDKLAHVSLDLLCHKRGMYSYSGNAHRERTLVTHLNKNALTADLLVKNIIRSYIVRAYMIQHGIDMNDDEGVARMKELALQNPKVRAFEEVYRRTVAEPISDMDYFPINGDLRVNNVFRCRDNPDDTRLHDFSLFMGPIQTDCCDLLESAGLTKSTKTKILGNFAARLQKKAKQFRLHDLKGLEPEQFVRDYNLVRTHRMYRRAAMLYHPKQK
jgi:hypothetical protein